MDSNPFDQFDQAPVATASAPSGNPFDQFDEKPTKAPNPFDAFDPKPSQEDEFFNKSGDTYSPETSKLTQDLGGLHSVDGKLQYVGSDGASEKLGLQTQQKLDHRDEPAGWLTSTLQFPDISEATVKKSMEDYIGGGYLGEKPTVSDEQVKQATGVARGLQHTAESLTSPLNIALAGVLPGAPTLVQKGAALYFAGQMAKQVPEQLAQAGAAEDSTAKAQAYTEAALNGLMAVMAFGHANGRVHEIPKLAPGSSAEQVNKAIESAPEPHKSADIPDEMLNGMVAARDAAAKASEAAPDNETLAKLNDALDHQLSEVPADRQDQARERNAAQASPNTDQVGQPIPPEVKNLAENNAPLTAKQVSNEIQSNTNRNEQSEQGNGATGGGLQAGTELDTSSIGDRTPGNEGGRPADAEGAAAQPTAPREADQSVEPLSARSFEDHPEAEAAKDWTSATEDNAAEPLSMKRGGGEAGAVSIPKFADRKMSELDRATTGRSAKLQKSFDEATRAQHEIADVAPSPKRQSAISVWMEADGDAATLKSWESAAKEKVFREAARDAQTLNPKEIALAKKAKATFDVLAKRGHKFDVLKSARDNYVPHVWEVKKEGRSSFGAKALQEKFKFSKARTFENFAEGDAAGFKPKTLEIGKLLPAYMHEMNKVIADRQFVRDIANGNAKDSRPLVVPRGRVSEIETEHGGKAFLANPEAMKGLKDTHGNPVDTTDYRTMENQPALHEWRWEGKDGEGNPIYMRDDLALHPEAAKRVNAMMGKSWFKEKLAEPSEGASAVGKAILRGIDTSQSVMKREMFGLLAPFHQVQEGTHAIAHRVNPFFGIEPVDMRKPKFEDAAKHGLMMLPDRATSAGYMEGIGGKGSFLTQALRWFGGKNENGIAGKAATTMANVVDGYQNYLFHQYIPSLKFKTYEKVFSRNSEVYAKELKSGQLTESDVKLLSAEQTNAAYGHLNRDLLDRSATQQHIMQLTLLAPDFLEARGRFVAQAVKGLLGSKVGEEQFKALAFMALVQAGAAMTITSLAGGKYDPKKPFSVMIGDREYTMRSVPEDLLRFGSDLTAFAKGGDRGMPFVSARINPLLQSLSQYLSGINYRGEKVSSLDTTEELLAKYIPITARSAPGLRSLTETSRQSPISPLEQLAGSLGLKISRHSPINDTYANASEWMEKNKVERSKGSYPISKYQQLRYALEDGDLDRAGKAYDELLKTEKADKIASGFRSSVMHPFTKSTQMDSQFSKTLGEKDRAVYNLAVQRRGDILKKFSYLRSKAN